MLKKYLTRRFILITAGLFLGLMSLLGNVLSARANTTTADSTIVQDCAQSPCAGAVDAGSVLPKRYVYLPIVRK
jgi:hypothetical protein